MSTLIPANEEKLRRYLELLRLEKRRRDFGGGSIFSSWARSYEGRPREFIAQLVGKEWYGADWAAWRSFVATLFGQELTPTELAYYRRCTGLDGPPAVGRVKRTAWVPVGRRGGKSRTLALITAYLSTAIDWLPYLAPGERGYIVVLAAQRKQAAVIMSYLKAALLGHPRLRPLVQNVLVESIDLVGNVTVEVVTASIAAVRSRTVLCALCDEIAFWRSDEASANPDAEILAALRPAMLTIPDSMLLAASSPYARKGALWEAYDRYYGKVEDPLVWQAPTRVMHPSVPEEFIREEYDKDPVAADAEYGANFRSDVAAYIPREAVRAVTVPGRMEVAPQRRSGIRYYAFIDPSGGSGGDSMTLAIAHRAGDGTGVLDCVRELRPPFSPEGAVVEFAETLKSYDALEVVGDRFGGEWPRERFKLHGIRYVVSEKTKSQIYREFMPLINAQRAELLDLPRLFDQVSSLERRTARGGRDSIDHPPGGHDDVANVAAGALVLAAGGPAPLIVTPEALRVAARAGAR